MKWIATIFISFALGYGLSFYIQEPEIVTITQTEVRTNTITRNVADMSCKDAREELNCYYTAKPFLDIKHISGDDFTLSAQLCERKWFKNAKIQIPRKEYRNMAIGGVFFDSELNPGIYSQYYRIFGRFGIGGGAAFAPGYAQITAGGVFLW